MMSTRIDMAVALAAAQGATAQAAEIGKPIAITVVDAGGYVIPQHRNDGVRTAATTVSAAKARASALFIRPSADVETLVSDTASSTDLQAKRTKARVLRRGCGHARDCARTTVHGTGPCLR